MSMSSICESALELPMKDRVALIDRLWDSIDLELGKEGQNGVAKLWADDSEQRIDACERGELKTLDGVETIRKLRGLVRK